MPKWAFGELKGDIRICKCGEVTLEDEMHLCRLEDKVTENPMKQIEDTKALMDIGKMGLNILRGAIEDGATPVEAATVLSSYYAGMFMSAKDNEDEEAPSS